jgi:hypothetical protein
MTATAFIQAIQGLPGLTQEMIRDINELAPLMTDKQREEYLAQFKQVSDELEKAGKRATESTKKAVDAVKGFNRKIKSFNNTIQDASSSQSKMKEIEKQFGDK